MNIFIRYIISKQTKPRDKYPKRLEEETDKDKKRKMMFEEKIE